MLMRFARQVSTAVTDRKGAFGDAFADAFSDPGSIDPVRHEVEIPRSKAIRTVTMPEPQGRCSARDTDIIRQRSPDAG